MNMVDPDDPSMVALAGGTFVMGSDRHYAEERPARRVSVGPFSIDRRPVSNDAFSRFVAATGYVTVAEIAPDPANYPGMSPDMAQPGSAVFRQPDRAVPIDDHRRWWCFVFGADWRHPEGPGSSLDGRGDHPVVHVAFADAAAYAAWAHKALPTEAEWEFAARGGLDGCDYAWGDTLEPGGRVLANYWRGQFPHRRIGPKQPWLTTRIGRFPANGFGLMDMIGNVWEWTEDAYLADRPQARRCCVSSGGHRGPGESDRDEPTVEVTSRTLKGGSHLCAENYCRRFRPAARLGHPVDTSTSHIGFRCVRRPP